MTAALEARYHRAKHDMHRAWVATQPQYAIPGLLDALDEPAPPTLSPEGGLVERARTDGDAAQALTGKGPWGALDSRTARNTTAPPAACLGRTQRGRRGSKEHPRP